VTTAQNPLAHAWITAERCEVELESAESARYVPGEMPGANSALDRGVTVIARRVSQVERIVKSFGQERARYYGCLERKPTDKKQECTHISAKVYILGISPSCDRIGPTRALVKGIDMTKRISW
jgi:hypothetical protein